MGDYADMAFDRDFARWEDDGFPPTPRVRVKAGDPCAKLGCPGIRVERTNRKTGERFLGCSEFPRCKG